MELGSVDTTYGKIYLHIFSFVFNFMNFII